MESSDSETDCQSVTEREVGERKRGVPPARREENTGDPVTRRGEFWLSLKMEAGTGERRQRRTG